MFTASLRMVVRYTVVNIVFLQNSFHVMRHTEANFNGNFVFCKVVARQQGALNKTSK